LRSDYIKMERNFMQLSRETKIYINYITITALILVCISLYLFPLPGLKTALFWVVLAIVGESAFVDLPALSGIALSVSIGISTASLIAGGPILAMAATLLGFMFRIEKINEKYIAGVFYYPFYKNVFNYSQIIICEVLAGSIYLGLGALISASSLLEKTVIVIIAITVKSLVNGALISKLFAIMSNKPFVKIWTEGVKQLIVPNVIVGSLGIASGFAYLSHGGEMVIILIGPVLLAKICIKQYLKIRQVRKEIINNHKG